MTQRMTHWIDGRIWDGQSTRSGEVCFPTAFAVTAAVDFVFP